MDFQEQLIKARWVSQQYKKKETYLFTVKNVYPGKKGKYRLELEGQYGNINTTSCVIAPPRGSKVKAKVNHIETKYPYRLQLGVVLDDLLDKERENRNISVPKERPFLNNRQSLISKLKNEVEGFGKHKCGKPFVCSLCGGHFEANQGYRVDMKEIYFCNSCKKVIYEPSGCGWAGRIISTPMGNKR